MAGAISGIIPSAKKVVIPGLMNLMHLFLKFHQRWLFECFNYVIHALHVDYKLVNVVGVTELVPDARIDELLESVSKIDRH